MNLVKYDAARQALAEAHRVDEVKDIRDKAVALAAYARLSKDQGMATMVNDIRVRAERRAGELLATMAKHPGTPGPGRGKKTPSSSNDGVLNPPTLKALGISHDESSAWQRLAKIPEPEFERRLKRAAVDQAPVTTRKLLRPQEPAAPRPSAAPHRPTRRPLPLEQALEEGRAWMAKWSHVAGLAEVFDLLRTLIESLCERKSDAEPFPRFATPATT